MKKYLAIATIIISVSCQKDADVFLNANDPLVGSYSTYTEQFNVIWSAVNSGYCFWDITDVDWDQRHSEMKPKFEALDREYANNGTSVTPTAFNDLYKEMFAGLKDHHMMLMIKDPHIDDVSINFTPAEEEVKSRSYYHPNDMIELISSIKGPYGDDFVYGGFALPDGTQSIAIATKIHTSSGKIIPYLWNSIFVDFNHVQKYVDSNKSSTDSTILKIVKNAQSWLKVYELSLKWVMETPKDSLAGVIIDVRSNNGGDSAGLSRHSGIFSDKEISNCETRCKEGMGRYDMSAWAPVTIEPFIKYRDMEKENLPVVVLADIASASCAEITTLAIQSLPTGCFVGERTYGAHGPVFLPNLYSITYGGSVGDSNLAVMKHFVCTSSFEMRPNGKPCLEGIGISPDIEVLYNDKGYTGQLQAALDVINNWGR